MVGQITIYSTHATESRQTAANDRSNAPSDLAKGSQPAPAKDTRTQSPKDSGINAGSLNDNMRDLASEVLSPKSHLEGERVYETLVSQTTENLKKLHNGALTEFKDHISDLASEVLQHNTEAAGRRTDVVAIQHVNVKA